ncbi:GntR family transcriptional regulator [Staphylococcus kloosii]|jgi:GntR family transcriptional regulator of bglA|uniref:GntR family transcriptional regulator n=3 Tax=Staphylococcus kloosii TaxID=29384 RepID=A0A921H0E1_9STAP|nr:GntR family transcriptional regulator [Staphylococcus kloosii]AVQ35369.1 GntR family transcriptional regulator [Staphylococcus kloosii]MBF7021306.1 GntR family transcriptional regulator [Staphylococcus kloosii]MBF7030583.1 GntR family transcriptional regulator [Staphylococcus kloosii]PNZ05943.1 GntR family transcriptional regulator [Staphylococcus kloosii]SUM48416.1 GntR family transcriptional regulator [Staphylococcus kloosii]
MLKYELVAQYIQQFIKENGFQAGDKLPNVESFKNKYEVSKSTVIKALEELEKNGIIFQTQGSGIYVRGNKRKGYMNLLISHGFKDEIENATVSYKVNKLEELIPSSNVREQLKLREDESVYFLERIIYVNKEILCKEISYFNKDIVLFLNKPIAEGSIFHYLENNLKVKIGFSDIYFQVDKLNEHEANILKLQEDDPCLRYEQIFYTTTGIPFDYSQLVYHYGNAQFYIPAHK